MKKQTLRVGFDLDGVLLYNPARIFRPIISLVKKTFLKRNVDRFYYPKNKIEQLIWNLLHKSSLWPAPGIDLLFHLIKRKRIKAYVVSARYESLKSDFNDWLKKIDPDHHLAGHYFNDKNDQPNLYKEKMIKKLDLDIFVEDNWDIVAHLRDKFKVQSSTRPSKSEGRSGKCKVFWIYNIFDRNIDYQYKFSSLKKVLNSLS